MAPRTAYDTLVIHDRAWGSSMDTPQGLASEAGTVRVLVVDDHCTFAELVVVALAL
jgi:hypothetical protein